MQETAKLVAKRELDIQIERLTGRVIEGDPPVGWPDWEAFYDWLPYYSSDISVAWELLDGYSVTLARALTLQWHCHLMRCDRQGNWINGDAHADTAPEAICRAFLAAESQAHVEKSFGS